MLKLSDKYPGIETDSYIVPGDTYIIESRVHGLFACFYCIIYGLYICEMEGLIPVVRLGKKHLYFDHNHGENIFEYFFERKHVAPADQHSNVIMVIHPNVFIKWCRVSFKEKMIANFLLKEHFLLKKEYASQLELFAAQHMSEFRVLGVHYRGTDKITENDLLAFDEYENKIKYILDAGLCDKIFFATDEFKLRERIAARFGQAVIQYNLQGTYDVRRSETDGLHFAHESPFLSAKDALMECMLLARSSMLMSSLNSSMSLFATFLNPEIPHIILEP